MNRELNQREPARVLLVHTPPADPGLPGLTCGLLQAVLESAGIPCDAYCAHLLASPLPGSRPAEAKAEELSSGLCAGIDWRRYEVVWFPVTLEQVTVATAMARRIREQAPATAIVFSSAPGSGVTRESLVPADLVVTGEVEVAAVSCIRSLLGAGGVPGHPEVVADVGSLPLPQYEPYFQQLAAHGRHDLKPVLPVEMARGCRCGAGDCPVCAAVPPVPFRMKTPQQVVAEVTALARHHRITTFRIVDIGLDPGVVESVLPELIRVQWQNQYQFQFACTLAAPVSQRQARHFRQAGVTQVQWRRTGPGLTAACVQTLKALAEAGVEVGWNLPAADGDVSALHHLPPPQAERGHPALAAWRQAYSPGLLTCSAGPGFVRITDRRLPDRGKTLITLVGLQAEIFRFCADTRTFTQIAAQFGTRASPGELRQFLTRLMAHRLMFGSGGDQYLTLPLQRRLEEVEVHA